MVASVVVRAAVVDVAFRPGFRLLGFHFACDRVAAVPTLDSKSSDRKVVGVQVPPPELLVSKGLTSI